MKSEEVENTIQTILIKHFNIPSDQFAWDQPLSMQCKDFEILSYLMYLEQLLNDHYHKKMPLLENISTDFHTPKDLLILIMNNL